MPHLLRKSNRSRPESSPAPGPQLQVDLSDAAFSSADAVAVQESSTRSRRRSNFRNRRFMSSETDSSRYTNVLPPHDPSSSQRRGAPITNSTRVVNLVDSSSASKPPKVPRVRVSDPARCPKKAKTAADSEKKGKADRSQKLKKALACSICLDLCYEPCTLSCSDTFCRSCLLDGLRACSHRCPCRRCLIDGLIACGRCPKCHRQVTVRMEGPLVNRMLWNSIQLLFPDECAQRKKSLEEKQNQTKDGDVDDRLPRPGTRMPARNLNCEFAERVKFIQQARNDRRRRMR